MSEVKVILADKGSQVLSINPTATVLDAAQLMNRHKVGSVVVLEEGHIVGMFTERDVLQRVVGGHLDPEHTPVKEVMTKKVTTCGPDTKIEEARSIMKHRRIRRLPVINNDQLVGLISIGDLNAFEISHLEAYYF